MKNYKYQVLIKDFGVKYEYEQEKRFRTYQNAYYFIANILWKNNPNYSWSCSLKYLNDGYEKKKIFPFGNTYVRNNKRCYKIKIQNNAIQNRKIIHKMSVLRQKNKVVTVSKRNGFILA